MFVVHNERIGEVILRAIFAKVLAEICAEDHEWVRSRHVGRDDERGDACARIGVRRREGRARGARCLLAVYGADCRF
jgi:hypothetical protein